VTYSDAQIRRFANMAAGRALHDVLNMAEFEERFPDPELREAVIDEMTRIATRLVNRGEHPPREVSG
jgi:hypothetical protein